MVIYYHTRRHIFAVTNGFCSAVVDLQGVKVFAGLEGSKLLCGTASDMKDEYAPDQIKVGDHLRFALGVSTVTTDSVTKVEMVQSLSIPPSPRSVPPESIPEGQPRVTLPEIIMIPKPG